MPILLREYDPRWPDLFAREAAGIRGVLGGSVMRLEHIGSTAVSGYVVQIREPEWFEHRMLKGPGTDINLHVFSAGCPEVERMVQFRDRLRADGAYRELYALMKRELAQREWVCVQDYAEAKSAVVAEIMERC